MSKRISARSAKATKRVNVIDTQSAHLKPEERVRRSVIAELIRLGWQEGQLKWKPEWQVRVQRSEL